MSMIKVALFGFGTVGQGVYQTIHSHQEHLQNLLGKEVKVAGVLVKDESKVREIDDDVIVSSDIDSILNIKGLDVVIEAIVGVEPGYHYLTKAINRGIHIVTANKELIAHKGDALKNQADKHGVRVEYEAAVAGGIPVIGTLKHLLRVNSAVRIEAILNGTSNYILTDILKNQASFPSALEQAQQKGYAEANPANDIDGWDAFYKLMILSDLLYGAQPEWENVVCRGIRNIELTDILVTEQAGFKIKHVASLELNNGEVAAMVEPVLVPADHPLFAVDGVNNAVVITGDLVGEVKLEGPGAGALPTASAMVEDFAGLYSLKAGKERQTTVNFANGFTNELQDWLFIGKELPYHSLHIYDKVNISVNEEVFGCWYVNGNEKEIREFLANEQQIKGYRISMPLSGRKAVKAVVN